ncbi:MAG: TonB-dependent siderophore receptor, partial [Sphingobacteriales bacterium]
MLKGSAAILYGNVAPGGIINMVTLQPKFERGAEVGIRAGSYGLIKPNVDVYGPLTKNIAARVNSTYESAESFRDHVSSERFYINPSLLFNIGKHSKLLFQGDYLHHDYTPDFGIGSLDNTSLTPISRSAFLGATWQYNKARQTTVTATLSNKLSKTWSLATTVSYQQYTRDYYSTERIQAKADGTWIRPLNKIDSKENYFLAQADLTGNFNTGAFRHRLLIGMDADRYNTLTYSFNNPTVYDTINILDPATYHLRNDIPDADKIRSVETPVHRAGFYVQDLISLHKKVKLLAGVRWSQQSSRAAATYFIQQDSMVFAKSKTDNALSPRAGIVFQPTKRTSL